MRADPAGTTIPVAPRGWAKAATARRQVSAQEAPPKRKIRLPLRAPQAWIPRQSAL